MSDIKLYNSSLQEPHMTNVINGRKKIEGRPKRDKWALMKSNEYILFNDKHLFRILDARPYDNFEDLLMAQGYQNVIPDANNLNEALDIYLEERGGFYSKEVVDKYGVVAIKLRYLGSKS